MTEKKEVKMRRVNVTISEDLDDKLMEKANEFGIGRSAMIRFCVHEYLKNEEISEFAAMMKNMQVDTDV